VRAGDAQAAHELVQQYEPAVRSTIRLRLTDPRSRKLRRVYDSGDIVQSIWGRFFVRAALGQFDLRTPNDLSGLLVTMAKNRLSDKAREAANKVPTRGSESPTETIAGRTETPSEIVAWEEMVVKFRSRMSPKEQRIAELRVADCDWPEVAAQVGGTPDGVRKQLDRAIQRIERQLGLAGEGDA
jgi:RNA polymerase sigma factor (sigma-70 family)